MKTTRAKTTTRISPKYQVVIPKLVRERMKLAVGMMVDVISYNGRIELVPLEPMKKARGIVKGIDTTIERDNDRL